MTYEQKITEIVLKDERFIILTAENRAAIRNLPSKIKDRFIDTGITEQTMIGMAAGLALCGRIPVTHALSAFLTMRAFEFIRTDVGISGLPVKLIGAVSGFLSEANGPTHQALEDISLMRSIPNINIFTPSDEAELVTGLEKVLYDPSPFYIRFNNIKAIYKHIDEFEIGKSEIISEGRDITILTYGYLFNESLKAAEILSMSKSVGLINLRTLKPIDTNAILNACRKSSLIVTVEDHFITGGIYTILCELLVRERINCEVFPIALNNKWFKPALLKDVLEYEGFTAARIAEKILARYEKIDQLTPHTYL